VELVVPWIETARCQVGSPVEDLVVDQVEAERQWFVRLERMNLAHEETAASVGEHKARLLAVVVQPAVVTGPVKFGLARICSSEELQMAVRYTVTAHVG